MMMTQMMMNLMKIKINFLKTTNLYYQRLRLILFLFLYKYNNLDTNESKYRRT